MTETGSESLLSALAATTDTEPAVGTWECCGVTYEPEWAPHIVYVWRRCDVCRKRAATILRPSD